MLYHSLYQDISSCVKWDGVVSPTFCELQGVRQGGIPSTELFKAQTNNLLNLVEGSQLGYRIGIIDCAVPTCADDSILLSPSRGNLQVLMNIALDDSHRERYQFSSKKSVAMVFNSKVPNKIWDEIQPWTLMEPVPVKGEEIHLGLVRTNDGKATRTVERNIIQARKSYYSLLGVGMYGLNGLHPLVSIHIWNTYVMPVLTFGLEVLPLTQGHLSLLEIFQRTILRSIQHLPRGTSNAATYLLLGVQPVEAVIDRNTLVFFNSLCHNKDSVEANILKRQILMTKTGSNSVVWKIKDLLCKYGLPSIHTLTVNPPPKHLWKSIVKDGINTYWTDRLQQEARWKTSLKHLGILSCSVTTAHSVWTTTPFNRRDIIKAAIKVKLLTGQYPLQTVQARWKQHVNNTCPLCDIEPETVEHFLLTCSRLQRTREMNMEKLNNIMIQACIPLTPSNTITTILDIKKLFNISHCALYDIESTSRDLIFQLHSRRVYLLSGLQENVPSDGSPTTRRKQK